MSRDSAEAFGLSPTLRRIESVCDRFEAAWQPRPWPRIEEYWQETDGTQLLRELLVLELVYRFRYHDHPNLGEYQARFPAHAGVIRSAFEAAGIRVSSPEPPSPSTSVLHDPDLHEALAPLDGFDRTNTIVESFDRAASLAPIARSLRFRMLRPLAKGGLGEVFVARDEELRREVALKLIREQHASDADSRDRFLFEAEITGRLEHPGVIPVYGLGVDGKGRPYYAMRFVRGESLQESIARFHRADGPAREPGERSLALRELLGRFTDVCNTIAYAHGRGVLHRDLKPANVMLGNYGETLVVDWGLAKIAGHPGGEPHPGDGALDPEPRSGFNSTKLGSWLGTPSFMSPEQAAGRIDLVGPASDVYSLGATLYNLLTGKPAFEGSDLHTVLSQVQEGIFPSPRNVEPRIDPALEAVCLKAMARTPEDRYASCRALADDVERWAADEPVSAWREPLGRRLRRWGKRNRTLVTAAAVALVASVVGLAAVLLVQTQAKAELSRSLARETSAKIALAAANRELERSKDAVQARYDLAIEAISTFHTGVSEDFLLKEDQFKELRDRLLKSASDFYGRLATLLGREEDPASRLALAQANFEVASLTRMVGRLEEALAAHRKVLAAREALASETGSGDLAVADVGRSLTAIGRLLELTGKTDHAEAAYREAEQRLAGPAGPAASAAVRAALAFCRCRLGWLLKETGHTAEALSTLRLARTDQEALANAAGATDRAKSDLAATVNWLGIVLSETGKASEAEGEYRAALAIQQKLADDNPAVSEFQSNLASTHQDLAKLLSTTDKMSEAESEFRKALTIQQRLTDDNPAVAYFRSTLAGSHHRLGRLLASTGNASDASAEYRAAQAIQQTLADNHPAALRFQTDLAGIHVDAGNLLSEADKPSEAEAEYRTALTIQKKLANDHPSVTSLKSELANIHINLGILQWEAGRAREAAAEYSEALAIFRKLADDNPAVTSYRGSLANATVGLATAHLALGRIALAHTAAEEAVVLVEAVLEQDRALFWRAVLGEALLRRGQARLALGDPAGSVADWRRAVATFDAMPPRDPEAAFLEACCHAMLAGAAGQVRSSLPPGAGPIEASRAIDILRHAVSIGFHNARRYRTEPALEPLRDRHDFRLLIMDLAMPDQTFAP
jgi:serine/threonine protein kinase/tetratricopeptide (TPR) repeat protein